MRMVRMNGAAAGLMDTLLRWKIEPEVVYGYLALLAWISAT